MNTPTFSPVASAVPVTEAEFEAMEQEADLVCQRLGIPLYAAPDELCGATGQPSDFTAMARGLREYMAKHAPTVSA